MSTRQQQGDREREPIIYVGEPPVVDSQYHNGKLDPAIGVHNYQVVRANRTHPADRDNRGYTYNHQPMLAYWKGRFWIQFLGSRNNEHGDPTETFLTQSVDGRDWDAPRVIFPAIEYSSWEYTIAHQRVGFYVAPNGRFLTLSFYGIPRPDDDHRFPNSGYGMGRAVREIYSDGSLGPIHWIRTMPSSGYGPEHARKYFPLFDESPDRGFVEACGSLLADKVFHQQMWEEDRDNSDGFFGIHFESPEYSTGKALSYWTNPDGTVTGIWKGAFASVTADRGESWSEPAVIPTIHRNNTKYWGQRTSDGRYVMVYSADDGSRRTPTVVITGEDGQHFSQMLLVHGDVPPERFRGVLRAGGQHYFRGIVEGNGTPPDGALWVAYSIHKEDIWISRIAVPITGAPADKPIDDFSSEEPETIEARWNLYSGIWTSIRSGGLGGRRCLVLSDSDPYDYAKATRSFTPCERGGLTLDLFAERFGRDELEVDLIGAREARPIRLRFTPANAELLVNATQEGAVPIPARRWARLEIAFDCSKGSFQLSVDGAQLSLNGGFREPADALCRLELRTGPYRMTDPLDGRVEIGSEPHQDLPDADLQVPETVYGLGHFGILRLASTTTPLSS
ncbi:MAG TPA: hypothetical protein VMW69_15000 [Spirochaetia bacterium]|nr:hypothetical protein [Spirochaetia bacterium]